MVRDNRTDFDRSKAGLQDDHDPSNPSQQAANKPHGVRYQDIQCDPSGASPKHNLVLKQHRIPPEVVVDCDQDTESDRLHSTKDQTHPTREKSGPKRG